MSNRHIRVFIFIGLSIIHFGIGLSFFAALGDGSEFATSLIRIIGKIKLTFLAFLLPAVVVFIYSQTTKDLAKAKPLHNRALIILSIVSLFAYYFIARDTAFPKQRFSHQDYMAQQINKNNDLKLETDNILKEVNQFIPPDSIQKKDKHELEEIIRKEWDNFYSPLMRKRPECEPFIARLHSLLNKYYDFIEKDSIIELRKRTTQTGYILYSPGYHYFIAILTYEISNNTVEKYGHITLLGQKVRGRMYCYAFTGTMQGGFGTSPTREGAVYRGLSDAFDYDGIDSGGNNNYGFGKDLLKLKPDENPPKIKFWISDGVKKLFKHKRDTTIPYKYASNSYNTDSVIRERPIWVYKN